MRNQFFPVMILFIISISANHVYAEDPSRELFLAIDRNDPGRVEALLADPLMINAEGDKGITPLIRATIKGNQTIAELLLNRGADINKPDRNGITPLMWAASTGKENLVKLFILRGASVNQKDSADGKTVLQWAYLGGNKKIVNLLKQAGATEETDPGMKP